MLEVRDVSVRMRSRPVLDGVGLDARRGEIVAIIGPNGAGKTTLLEVIAGVRRADRGTVAFDGALLDGFSERAERLIFSPERGELPVELDVRDVVDHALRFRPRAGELLSALWEALGIEPLLSQSVGVLSRGEHQRVSLFVALSVDRPVVVLDEPWSAFDPLKLRDVLHAARRVADSGSVVLATVHHLGDAAKIADRILILAQGRAIAAGTLESLGAAAGVSNGSLDDIFIALLRDRRHAP